MKVECSGCLHGSKSDNTHKASYAKYIIKIHLEICNGTGFIRAKTLNSPGGDFILEMIKFSSICIQMSHSPGSNNFISGIQLCVHKHFFFLTKNHHKLLSLTFLVYSVLLDLAWHYQS